MNEVRFHPQPSREACCPFCRDALAPETEVVTCGGCGAPYHPDCLAGELGACASLGCEVRPELGNRGPWGDLNDRRRQRAMTGLALAIRPPRGPAVAGFKSWVWSLALLVVGMLAAAWVWF